MRNFKRTLSFLTSVAVAASTFSAVVIPANAAEAEEVFSAQEIDIPLLGNAVSITEPFGATAAAAPENGDNYTWGTLTIADKSYQSMTAIQTGAVSLTTNKGLDLITFADGVGGADKDISMSFDGGTVNGFGQDDYTWDLVFKDTKGSEMFRYRYISGGWNKRAGLVVNGEYTQVAFTHTNNVYTNFPLYISFNYDGGGEVTLGTTTLPFANGQSLGAVSIENSGPKDWDRSLVIDNVSINTVNKQTVTLNLSSSEAGKSVADAEVIIGDKTYTADDNGKVTAFYLAGEYSYTIKCAEHSSKTGTFTVADDAVTENITLDYVGPSVVTTVTIGGGDEYIYLPTTGETKSNAFTVTVYDNAGLEMDGESVDWSLPGAKEGVSINENGVITLLPTYALTDDNGVDLTIRATSKSVPSVSCDTTIHIHNTARVTTFDVVGPMVVKDGQTADLTVTNVKDQYKNDYTADDTTYTVTADDANVTVEGMKVTPNIGTAQVKDVELTVTASTNEAAKSKKTITVYGYDFYEPGVGQASCGEPRMETIGDNSYIVWPKSAGAAATNKITFPVPVNLEAGTAKMISYKTAWTNKQVGSQERSLQFVNSEDTNVVKLGYNGSVGINPVKVSGKFVFTEEGSYEIGAQGGASTWEETIIILKTDSEGVTTGLASYGGGQAVEFSVGENLSDIASMKFIGGQGAPDDRLLGIKDIKISDSDVAEVEISGDSYIAKIEGKTATKKYKGSVFSISEDETFTWSCTVVDDEVSVSAAAAAAVVTPNESAENAVLIKAVYGENGKFESMTMKSIGSVTAGTPITVEAPAGTKVMLWNSVDGTNGMKPLAAVAVSEQAEVPTDAPTDKPTQTPGGDEISIDENGVLYIPSNTTAKAVLIKYASNLDENKYATKLVEIKDFANVDSFTISGPAAINAGETVSYKATNIVDEYGDKVDMNVSYALTKGTDIAAINSETGVITTSADKTGEIEVSVTVGNTGKTKTLTKTAKIAKYAEVGTTTDTSVVVDVTAIADYSADRVYRVTTANDGVLVSQKETKAVDGKITVDTTGADSYEVSPTYSFDNVGNVSAGYEIPLADGLYDFTFKKANGTRADIFVNGYMVGQNVDQYGKGRSTSGSYYSVKDINVTGGNAVVTMKDQTSEMTSIEVKKAATIVDRKTHVYILGDSLAATYYGEFADADGDGIPAAGDAQTGWGQVFDKFAAADMNVTNLAESGNYAKGLYASTFPTVIANGKPGDYMLFECGYNDKNYSNAAEMQEIVRAVYAECQEAGIIPIFVTPNASVHGTGWKANVQLAADLIAVTNELGAKCIDLSGLSFAYYSTTKADEAASKEYTGKNFNVYYEGAQQDSLHSSYYGALKNAEIVAQAIYDMQKTDSELSGLKINTDVSYTLRDSEGDDLVFQVK